ncbi:neuraminidase-like domain-containing protein [Pseudomonas chlororaphis]|uniref:Tc toxin subunit A-related protein n=1 Tax=Pseudomonas chlororaphis TaxID=587753 RepID=UPI0023689EF9|nr:neuraminidase-like domain-containing protein [Pseudomonas chlororaphis]WDG77606.1 neuraminidase-like domain-containing protein [Pseudomonas chlororaphis]WDG83157.1 neuraminidase-like domain-containing protein [Pseudomonas chlororaphis]
MNESLRDALVMGYMNFVAPSLKNVGNTPLTTEDLYEYLLIDPEVGDEVQTSRVASAISSLQQYMTRIINDSEPGFQPVVPSDINAWRDGENQYAIWAAGADVLNYAENYISPTTRLEKSHYFKDLETTLNQNQLDPDRVQDTALAYLNQFEAVSNLYVLSGYISQDKLAEAVYYFIGRTTTKPYQYYWRQMDLSQNGGGNGAPVTPNCWSDWLPINLPLAGDTILEHTVRPVFYNERLYVSWVERDPSPLKDAEGKDTTSHAYRVNFGYKRFDDSWTAPNSTTLMTWQKGDEATYEPRQPHDRQVKIGVETERQALVIDEAGTVNGHPLTPCDVNLLATADFSIDPDSAAISNPYGRLMLGVFVRRFDAEGEEGKNAPDIYGYQYCDSAFNRHTLGPQTKEELFAIFQDKEDTNTLQYALYKQKYVIESVEQYRDTDTPPYGYDIHGSSTSKDDISYKNKWWERINNLDKTEKGQHAGVYMSDDFTLCVDMRLNGDFLNDFEFTKDETDSGGDSGFGLCRSNDDWGVTIRYHDGDYYTFQNTVICYEPKSFGSGDICAGNYYLSGVYPESGSYAALMYPDIYIDSDHNLSWSGGKIATGLSLDGVQLHEQYDLVNRCIEGKQMRLYLSSEGQYSSLPTLKNFNKIADTRLFFNGIGFSTAKSDSVNWGPSTFELTQNSDAASYSQCYRISESDFTADQRYISVRLIVGDHRIDRRDRGYHAQDYVWKWFKVHIKKEDVTAPAKLPQLKSRYNNKRGLVQYLDFCDSNLPANTRLNTTFVRTLIERASLGLDSLLDYTLQADKTLEASLDNDHDTEAMDFNGANGLYFWELFFHLPFLVASRFGAEQQFDQAQKWLHYIFDPAMRVKDTGVPAYWNVRPLVDWKATLSHLLADPLDPDAQAYAHPEVYQKAVFIAYVSNLIAQGDQWYRQLTRDGLTQARVFYNLAAELLGPRPDVSLSSSWTPQTVDALANAESAELRDLEQMLGNANPALPAMAGRHVSYLRLADNSHFIAPLNTLMLAHWDTLDARLYNLRHNLTVDGKPLSLALFAAPADPLALLTQRAQSGTLVGGVSGTTLVVPPYRFNAILPRAYNAVATLSRFGEGLLSLLERGDRASQEELQQQQFLDMSSYAITLQQQTIDGLVADRAALMASQAMAQKRYDRYYALYQENISSAEQQVMDTHTAAQSLFSAAQGVQVASGALKLIPNIFGFADGGSRYEGATEAIANGLLASGQATSLVAERLATTEGYRRRRQEWQIQYEQAQAEVDALSKQLDALTIREKAAQTALQQAKAQQAQIQAMLNFLKTRFTQATLYQWLSGQLAALYYQAYDSVVSLCLSAQACWQYELADFATTFIQTGAWNDHYRGLQVGETLQLNLHQMEAAYLARHERRLEVTRTVSLVDLLSEKKQPGTFDEQKANGSLSFNLTEQLFDKDYPGHYLRQIKSVSISLPTLLGPYQDVKATLTQTMSSTLLKADIEGVKYLNGKDGSAANIVTNLRASQQIALSSGLNDAGQFELNFGDERYLPFEGTGAVSNWTLAFPRHDKSDTQKALLEALTDVIVHVRYSALDGGASFAADVEETLKP